MGEKKSRLVGSVRMCHADFTCSYGWVMDDSIVYSAVGINFFQ